MLTLLALCVVLGLKVFLVRHVAVNGLVRWDPAVVEELAALSMEESVFQVNFRQVRENIEANPYFEVVYIGFSLPDTVVIELRERQQSAAVQFGGETLIADEDGFVLESRPALGDLRVPVVSGLELLGFEAGAKLEAAQPLQMDALRLLLLGLREEELLQSVAEINLGNPSAMYLMTADGFTVELGNIENLAKKLKWFGAAWAVLVSEGKTPGIITVSTGDAAYYRPAQEGGEGLDLLPDDSSGDEPPEGDAEPLAP
jgi:cell division protein FtsQ